MSTNITQNQSFSTSPVPDREPPMPPKDLIFDDFVVLNVEGTRSRQGWVVWDEEGRYPDVIVELMSPSTKNVDIGGSRKHFLRNNIP